MYTYLISKFYSHCYNKLFDRVKDEHELVGKEQRQRVKKRTRINI